MSAKMKAAETVEVVRVWSPLPTEPGPPIRETAPVVYVPPVVVEKVQPCSARRDPRCAGSCG